MRLCDGVGLSLIEFIAIYQGGKNELQMESNAFGSSHLPSQALVVLSEAASGLHEALRGQRPFPSRVSRAQAQKC